VIIQDRVKVLANSGIIRFYKNIIPNIQRNKEYDIDVKQLIKTSHIKILVECDICHKQSMKPYRQYLESFNKRGIYCCSSICAQIKNKKTNLDKYGFENVFQTTDIKNKIVNKNNEKYGVDYHTQSDNFKEKSKITNMERYGTDNAAQSELIKNKMKETCLKKYGVDNYNKSKQSKDYRIKMGTKIPDELKTDYEKYLFEVRFLTNNIKKILFKNWNGYDYYDNKYIKENLKLNFRDRNYPTLDHKISIYYGFLNNILPKIIGGYDNLCITKRYINSSKNTKSFMIDYFV